jgi:hypothetical protein
MCNVIVIPKNDNDKKEILGSYDWEKKKISIAQINRRPKVKSFYVKET